MAEKSSHTGFTLAEVLVTLGIIGVVAAMTINALIKKYQKYQTAIQLKAAYALLGKIVSYSIAENGEPKFWKISLNGKQEYFDTYILPYVPNIQRIKNESAYTEYKEHAPFGTGWIYYADLTNGLRIIFESWGRSNGLNMTAQCGAQFVVDLNGKKKPNKWGRDLFRIKLDSVSSQLFFDGLYNSSWKNNTNYSDCSIQYQQRSRDAIKQQCLSDFSRCGALIYYDNFEILDDYPWYQ